MKLIIIIILLSGLNLAIAMEKQFQTWNAGPKYYSFLEDPKTKALVSENCIEKLDKKEKCMAMTAKLQPKKMSFTEQQLKGGKNPTSLLCKLAHQGEVIILKNADGNENSFCLFNDHTLISANDLD